MKNFILIFLFGFLMIGTLNAQDDHRLFGTTSKSGQNILPSAGDVALGIDAAPFLQYMGNFFTNSNNSSPSFNGVGNITESTNTTIYGKYFTAEDKAFRARLSLGRNSLKLTTEVPDLNSDDPEDVTKDSQAERTTAVEIGLGYELRRGYGRLQGFVGGEVILGAGNTSTKNKYGNKLTEDFPFQRTLSTKEDRFSTVGLGAFIGVEYFIAPKVSIGGELGLGLLASSYKSDKWTYEYWDNETNNPAVETDNLSNDKLGHFNLGTNANGRLVLLFHF